MLVCVDDLHRFKGANFIFYDQNLSISHNERLPPCWPTTHPLRACRAAFAWASSPPTTLVSLGPLPSWPCPLHNQNRDTRSIRTGNRLSERSNNFECCTCGSCPGLPARRQRDTACTRREILASLE